MGASRRRHVPPPVLSLVDTVKGGTSVPATREQERYATALTAEEQARASHAAALREVFDAQLAVVMARVRASQPSELMRYREAAAYVGLGLTAFREVVASGVIPQQRHPEHNAVRVRRADVEAYRAAMSFGGSAVRAGEGSR